MNETAVISIGWAEVDITPVEQPVLIAGQFEARLSEEVDDPLKAAICALESGGEQAVFVCCDLVSIAPGLRDAARERLRRGGCGVDPEKVIFHATHTHDGPETSDEKPLSGAGIDVGAKPANGYTAFVAEQLARGVERAWESRAPGGIAYGLEEAVLGRSRRWVDGSGAGIMYGLEAPQSEGFRHIEGYEDHSLNLLATYDGQGALTGLIINIPCTAQEDGNLFSLSADYWFEARRELRRRYGEKLFILPQVSAAGELTPTLIHGRKALERMLRLRGRTAREEIAARIADAVGRLLPVLEKAVETTAVLRHRVEMAELPLNPLTQAQADEAARQAEEQREIYECEKRKLEADPALRSEPRWYVPVSRAFRRMKWHLGVVKRFERLKQRRTGREELHLLRLGEIAFATNPFELYLDFGIQMKVRSPAIQTFLVQLAGHGTYVPSPRSVVAGGYGSVPASNPYGPEAGQRIVDDSVRILRGMWEG